MKRALTIFSLLTATSALATPVSIICRNNQLLNSGALEEAILTKTATGYSLRTHHIASPNLPELKVETWANNLKCRIDEKSPVTFCQNTEGQVVSLTEHRQVFFGSLEDEKKTTLKSIEISLSANGTKQKTLSFSFSHCQIDAGEA